MSVNILLRDFSVHERGQIIPPKNHVQVRGFQPVVVNFVSWRDREEVLRNAANKLRGTNIYITEDMSKKMREHRHELQKYARQASD